MILKIENYPFTNLIDYKGQYCGIDTPGSTRNSIKDFYSYPVQDFDYKFNSWGFRDEDFTQYLGHKINICLGDSMTLNFGGPVEHSWCSQLKSRFDIPTLNFGIAGAGNDAIAKVYKSLVKIFDIQNTFVMYGYLHRHLINEEFVQNPCTSDEENFEYFLKHRIPNAIECALPSWCWSDNEKKFLYYQKIYFFDVPLAINFSDHQTIDRRFVVKKSYNNLRGPDWPTYEQFINGDDTHPDMFTKEFGHFISYQIYTNRDGHHMNYNSNKLYANYLYKKWKQKNES